MKPQPAGAYGTWSKSDVPFTIAYSLAAFHEISFLVNEGYRRIPYGGIEHGGLLFGSKDGDALKVDSFRQIECEHAAGPGFSLSPQDIAGIEAQLRNSATDPELLGLKPIGCFVSYSRRDLAVSPADLASFRLLFSEPWPVLFLVKPEKFKPTRFACVFPNQSEVLGDINREAFILPLPGRREGPLPEPNAPEEIRPATPPTSIAEVGDEIAFEAKPPQGASAVPELPAELATARPEQPMVVPAVIGRRVPILLAAVSAVLIWACGAWFYQTYEAPAIKLHVAPANRGILVSWAAEESSGIRKAELCIWQGQIKRVVQLSDTQKKAGRVTIPIQGDDLTIELVSHHWMQDRRGMARLLGAAHSR